MKRKPQDGPAVILEGVTRSFGGRQVLSGVTAEAAAGKVVALLGRNGSGKTTLFKIMADLLEADSGRVEVSGVSPDGTGAIRQSLGYIPERPAFHDFMTVGEVFALRSRFFAGWKSDRALAMAKRLGLDRGTRIAAASKGTLGKVAWVCAAAHDPGVYLLDEPTSGLDALVREDLLGHMIEELQGTGKTILMASHHLEEMAGLLDQIWVISGGRIQGVYEAETLRTEACRMTGRLRPGARLPERLPVLQLPGEGPLVEWVALAKPEAEMIAASGLLENMQRDPLPMETTLKMLLKDAGGQP